MSRDNPRHLERGWKTFEQRVLSATVPDVQRTAMRDGFYAGAFVAFSTLIRGVSDGNETTPEDMHLMADIDAELSAFARELDQRVAQDRAGLS